MSQKFVLFLFFQEKEGVCILTAILVMHSQMSI